LSSFFFIGRFRKTALENSKRMTAIYSHAYVNSKICQDEFNVAFTMRYDKNLDFIYPIYWQTAELDQHMKLLNHNDCRETEKTKLQNSCNDFLRKIAR
jgi:hypothetical protein